MRTAPTGIPGGAELIDAIASGWAVRAVAIDFMPVGLDAGAAAFTVRGAMGTRWFLKVLRDPPRPAAIAVPQHLRRIGLVEAIAPLLTEAGRPWLDVAGCFALLYPFVSAPSVWDAGLSDPQWEDLGRFIGAMHRATIPADVAAVVPVDDFDCPALPKLRDLLDRRIEIAGAVTAVWHRHGRLVEELVARAAALGATLRRAGLPKVLCHADLHGGNILAGASGPVSVVDWDAPVIAAPERDFIFIDLFPFGANHSPDRFAAGYGSPERNDAALAYYGYERILEDVYEFTAQLLDPRTGPDDAADALYWLDRQFAPGGAVELVRDIDRRTQTAT
jgi:spectinomycin phosphotransferase